MKTWKKISEFYIIYKLGKLKNENLDGNIYLI